MNEARKMVDEGKFMDATMALLEAQGVAQQEKNVGDEARALDGMGHLYKAQRQAKSAVNHWEQAVELYQDVGDAANGAECAFNLGQIRLSLDEASRQAAADWRVALTFAKESGNQEVIHKIKTTVYARKVRNASASFIDTCDELYELLEDDDEDE